MGLVDKIKDKFLPKDANLTSGEDITNIGNIAEQHTDIQNKLDRLDDDLMGFNVYETILSDKELMKSLDKWMGSHSGVRGWNSGDTWVSTTSYIPRKSVPKCDDPDKFWRKACDKASNIAVEMGATDNDLQRMLVDARLMTSIASVLEGGSWDDSFAAVTSCKADDIIEACNAIVLWRHEYPLSEEDTRNALYLMNKLGLKHYTAIHDNDESYTSEYEDREGEHSHYYSEIRDAHIMWKSASEAFCGHYGMIPVTSLSTISNKEGNTKLRRSDVEALAALIGADSMFASYDAGVPVEDVIA